MVLLAVYVVASSYFGICLLKDAVLLTIFRLKIIIPVERIEIFTNFVSANDEKY
jgi:hypothetical protein